MLTLTESLIRSLNENAYSDLSTLSLKISKDIVKETGFPTPKHNNTHDYVKVEKDGISITPDYSRGYGDCEFPTNSLVGFTFMSAHSQNSSDQDTIGIHIYDNDANLFLMVSVGDRSYNYEVNSSNAKNSKWEDYKIGKDNNIMSEVKNSSKKLYDLFNKIIKIFDKHLKEYID